MVANPYRIVVGGYLKPASSQRLMGLALALITAVSAQAQEVLPTPDVPPTIRAAPVQATVHLDGDLSETNWQRVVTVRVFRQAEPQQGNPAKFDSEVCVKNVDECAYSVGNLGLLVNSLPVMRSMT